MLRNDTHEENELISIDTIKRWGFANPKLAVNAAHQMQLVDGVAADDLRMALIEAVMSVRDDVHIPASTAEIAAMFEEETTRVYPMGACKPPLDDYDHNGGNEE